MDRYRTEWYEVVDAIKPHLVQLLTPRGRGTGIFLTAQTKGDLVAVATAAHVVQTSEMWEEPVRMVHPSSGESRLLRFPDRAVFYDVASDTAIMVFERKDFPLPNSPIDMISLGNSLRVGNEIGWLGFPSVAPNEACFFTGQISAWLEKERTYLVDGVAINGVSGGPAFTNDSALIGIVSEYWPNMAVGTPLPGLSVIRDVHRFHDFVKGLHSLDDAISKQQTQPASPPAQPGSRSLAARSLVEHQHQR